MLGETMGVMACCELGDYDGMQGFLDRALRLARQLGARRFESQALEFGARGLLDRGERNEAAKILREAFAILDDVGMPFCGPKVAAALSRATDDPGERVAMLAEGAKILQRGAVGHNHLWYHRDAIEAYLSAGESEAALRHVVALEDYTSAEPLPWAELFARRGRALAQALSRTPDEGLRDELARIRATMLASGLKPFLPPVEAALAG
jgi:tetratricopeptide (TPR) repeat protein